MRLPSNLYIANSCLANVSLAFHVNHSSRVAYTSGKEKHNLAILMRWVRNRIFPFSTSVSAVSAVVFFFVFFCLPCILIFASPRSLAV